MEYKLIMQEGFFKGNNKSPNWIFLCPLCDSFNNFLEINCLFPALWEG